jgi:threonine/homoserine efflux transporter RhtA
MDAIILGGKMGKIHVGAALEKCIFPLWGQQQGKRLFVL